MKEANDYQSKLSKLEKTPTVRAGSAAIQRETSTASVRIGSGSSERKNFDSNSDVVGNGLQQLGGYVPGKIFILTLFQRLLRPSSRRIL